MATEDTQIRSCSWTLRLIQKSYGQKLGKKWSIGILNGPKSELESKEVKTGLIRICKALEKNGCELDNYYMPKAFNDAHFYHQLIYCKCLSYYFKCEYKNNKDQLSSSFIEMIEYGNKISNKKPYLFSPGRSRPLAPTGLGVKKRYFLI